MYINIQADLRLPDVCFLLFRCQKSVDLLDQRVCIGSVNRTSILNGFAAGCGAAQAMHANGKKELRGLGIKIQNVANDGLFGYYHFLHSFPYRFCRNGHFQDRLDNLPILYPKTKDLSITKTVFFRKITRKNTSKRKCALDIRARTCYN